MHVSFSSTALQKAYEMEDRAVKKWGPTVARKFIQRIEALYSADTFDDLRTVQALGIHQLEGDRKGEWAIKLTRRARLVVVPSQDAKAVTVKEVSQHYGD